MNEVRPESRRHDAEPSYPDQGEGQQGWTDLSFLAPPGELADWRMVLAYEAGATSGVLAELPGTPAELAQRCGLDEGALHTVLGQLVAYGILTEDHNGRHAFASGVPRGPEHATLLRHAAAIRRWSSLIGPRLRDRTSQHAEGLGTPLVLTADRSAPLAAAARRSAREVVEVCVRGFPHAERVLDLGGGHGEHAREFARRGLRPTVQDLPQVVDEARTRNDLQEEGVELFAGDLTTTLAPGPFDLVFCSTVTNMLDASRNRDLYLRLRTVVSPGGGVAIVSYMRGRDEVAAGFGLQMLVWTDGGDAHSAGDYTAWLGQAGFGAVSVHELDRPTQTVVMARA